MKCFTVCLQHDNIHAFLPRSFCKQKKTFAAEMFVLKQILLKFCTFVMPLFKENTFITMGVFESICGSQVPQRCLKILKFPLLVFLCFKSILLQKRLYSDHILGVELAVISQWGRICILYLLKCTAIYSPAPGLSLSPAN